MEKATKFFEFNNDFSSKPDEEIVAIVKEGSKEALNFLLNKYKEIIIFSNFQIL